MVEGRNTEGPQLGRDYHSFAECRSESNWCILDAGKGSLPMKTWMTAAEPLVESGLAAQAPRKGDRLIAEHVLTRLAA